MAASFTHYCCRSGGSNLYAGTLDGSTTEASTTPLVTYTSGNWVSATRVFTVASGNPVSAGVTVGMFASVYADGASAPSGFGGRISAVTTTTITVHATASWGTSPADGTGTRTLVVGGAWLGPSGASGFPLNAITEDARNAASDVVRVNMKNDQTYSITAAISVSSISSGAYFSGYSASYGDGGRWTLDGGTSGASYVLLTLGAATGPVTFADAVFSNNGATGSAAGLSISSISAVLYRCVVHSFRGAGVSVASSNISAVFVECEFYGTNQSNTASTGALTVGASALAECVRCVFHDNTGSNTDAVRGGGGVVARGCVFDSNGRLGVLFSNNKHSSAISCDFYNNGSDGISLGSQSGHVESCNFLDNAGWGISGTGNLGPLYALNCGFGSGSAANGSGDIQTTSLVESGTVNYASGVLPWVDAANGDFRINSAAARGAGRGSFLQTAASYAGSVAYPDIGSNQTRGVTVPIMASGGGMTRRGGGGPSGGSWADYRVMRLLSRVPLPAAAGAVSPGVSSDAFMMRWGMPLWWPTTAPSLATFDLDNAADQFEVIFQAHEPVTVTRAAIRYSSITGTAPTFKLSLQGVDGTGLPDGTIKGGGSPVSKTFNATSLSWAAGVNWLTFDNPYTCTRGEWLALVVAYDSGTINASNKMQVSTASSVSAVRTPYCINNNAGVRSRVAGGPVFGWGSATKIYGAPTSGAFNRTYHSASTPDEWAFKWTLPASYGASYKVAGLAIQGAFNPLAGPIAFKLYDTDGTTVLQDLSYDADISNNAGTAGFQLFWFDEATLADLTTGVAYRLGVAPQASGGSMSLPYLLLDSTADGEAHPGGLNVLQSSRSDGGAWTDVTTGRFFCDLFITALTPSTVEAESAAPVVVGAARRAAGGADHRVMRLTSRVPVPVPGASVPVSVPIPCVSRRQSWRDSVRRPSAVVVQGSNVYVEVDFPIPVYVPPRRGFGGYGGQGGYGGGGQTGFVINRVQVVNVVNNQTVIVHQPRVVR